ncbi:dipeptide ABC transporter ATP-binding protein [Xanthobacter sp. ZOL 2024]
MAEPLVTIDQLAMEFRTLDGFQRILNGVSLRIDPGEIVGLVGETGSGKSVTAKYLLGILPMPPARVVDGTATLFGKTLPGLPKAEREDLKRFIAYVPQDPMAALNPSFKIGSQMSDVIIWERCGRRLGAYLLERHRPAARRQALDYAAHLLEKVHITDPRAVLKRYPVQLSGGMRQRVLLALAISGTPRLLIADEPTTALDVTVQKKIVEIIQELVEREKLAGLYITHDLGVARWLCARTYVMYRGAIVESGQTAALLDHPGHPYTRRLVDAIPRMDATPADVPPAPSPAEAADHPQLRVAALSKSYGGAKPVQAVKSVSFDIRRGETFAIVGESGSGKSTTAQMLARIIEPSAGTIAIDGRDITHLEGAHLRELRRTIQMVFQDPGSALNPRQTIEQIVALPLKLHGGLSAVERRDRVAELLEAVDLPVDFMKRTPPSLSGGQKQRINIARALALRPQILVLDEPTSALDVSVQARILDLLKTLKAAQNLTYVLITHDLGVVRAIADRIAVMYLGEIVETGPTDQILYAPRHAYTRSLISAVPLVHEEDRVAFARHRATTPAGSI